MRQNSEIADRLQSIVLLLPKTEGGWRVGDAGNPSESVADVTSSDATAEDSSAMPPRHEADDGAGAQAGGTIEQSSRNSLSYMQNREDLIKRIEALIGILRGQNDQTVKEYDDQFLS